ncbi:hypothetical protein BT96DRAFT_424292 [Gymnopus androsaceus JB14]|uniref:Uncharacterized protein n=1 Tax=Gymnopus androsaceus JB14 TaxID=1447944 RepID=A0A6A4HY67_9AGAR|nr:hypothetical protein BT96DRAFT_424292 [Gymnopus androsaceus JB14]
MSSSVYLPPDAAALAIKEAKKEGLFAGLTAALASTLIGSKFLGLKRYPSLACGASKCLRMVRCSESQDSNIPSMSTRYEADIFSVTAVLSGYYFTEAFTAAHLAKIEREMAKQQAEKNGTQMSDL